MPLIAKACCCYALGLFLAATAPPPFPTALLLLTLGGGAVALLLPAAGIGRNAATCALLVAGGTMAAIGASAPHAGRDAAVHGASGFEAALSADAPRDGLVALRARVGRRIDRVFGADAPVVRALVIADMSAIPAEQRDRFARAGLVHMLSVSGLHVAIVALALELLASALRLPRLPAHLATLALLGGYVLLIGAPPPAVRAAVMLALVIACRCAQRPTSRWAVVAVGSTVPLVDPAVVTDLGWQLSVAGTIALVAGGALARRVVPRRWRGARGKLASAAVISVVATLATAPLVAWTFGRLALLGPVTNLLADPVMGLLQPLLFLALCLPFGPVERLLADAAHGLIATFDGIAAGAAAIPFAAPAVLPSRVAAVAGGISAVALVRACLARAPARAALVGLAGVAVMVVEPMVWLPRSRTELHMLDVGQGDALAVRTRAGRWLVIDAGGSWRGGDAGRATLVPYLAHRGGEVALFVLSHPHADHVGGAASLFDALHPRAFLDPGHAGTSPPYAQALAAARRDGVRWRRVRPGDSLVVDEVVISLLAPDSAWTAGLADANLSSTVARLRVGDVRVLFTGDAEGPEEDWLLAHAGGELAADVLKVAHHGSATSTTPAFLAAVRPRVALVSVGAHNTYGHPSAEVMAALQRAGAEVLRTDRLGTVVLRTDGRTLEVEARGTRWTVPPRAPR